MHFFSCVYSVDFTVGVYVVNCTLTVYSPYTYNVQKTYLKS